MTAKEAHAIVVKECRRRGRKYGAENKARLRAMRADIAELRDRPTAAKLAYAYQFTVVRSALAGQAGGFRRPVRFN